MLKESLSDSDEERTDSGKANGLRAAATCSPSVTFGMPSLFTLASARFTLFCLKVVVLVVCMFRVSS